MRQYTTPEQTAKLIELGFEEPKGWCAEGISSHLHMYKRREDDEGFNYSIGELIEMLPKSVWSNDNNWPLMISICVYDSDIPWSVSYIYSDGFMSIELIDALYNMVVKLKDKGVI